MPGRSADPFEALSLSEAAQRAGRELETIEAAIAEGRLLSEVGRRDGEEVRIVRLMDLAEVWPDAMPGGRKEPEPAPESAPEPAPEPPATPSPDPPRAQPEPVASDSVRQALEVRLASLQSSNDALATQVKDLQLQRSDLKDQCVDLRGRMVLIEKERQAGTAGLLLAQRRLMELEAAPVVNLDPWWRRPAPLTACAGFALFTGLGLWQWERTRGTLEEVTEQKQDQASTWSSTLQEHQADRERWEASLASTASEWDELLEQRLADAAKASAADRDAWELELAEREQALADLEAEARAEEELFEARLNKRLEAEAKQRQDWLVEDAARKQAFEEALEEALDRADTRAEARLALALRASDEREAALRKELEEARLAVEATGQTLEQVQAREARYQTLLGEWEERERVRAEDQELQSRRESVKQWFKREVVPRLRSLAIRA